MSIKIVIGPYTIPSAECRDRFNEFRRREATAKRLLRMDLQSSLVFLF